MFELIDNHLSDGDAFRMSIVKVDGKLKVSLIHSPKALDGKVIPPLTITVDDGAELDEEIEDICLKAIEPTEEVASNLEEEKAAYDAKVKRATEKKKVKEKKKAKKEEVKKEESSTSLFNQAK